MRVFFDTSVLVPVFLEDHQHHDASIKLLLKTAKKDGWCGAHSLAEIYSALTRLPGKHRLSGEQTLLFLQDLTERLTTVALTADEYYRAIKAAAVNGVVGGTIYDALLTHCALKVEAEIIYTWNLKHFRQLGAEVSKCLRTP